MNTTEQTNQTKQYDQLAKLVQPAKLNQPIQIKHKFIKVTLYELICKHSLFLFLSTILFLSTYFNKYLESDVNTHNITINKNKLNDIVIQNLNLCNNINYCTEIIVIIVLMSKEYLIKLIKTTISRVNYNSTEHNGIHNNDKESIMHFIIAIHFFVKSFLSFLLIVNGLEPQPIDTKPVDTKLVNTQLAQFFVVLNFLFAIPSMIIIAIISIISIGALLISICYIIFHTIKYLTSNITFTLLEEHITSNSDEFDKINA